MIVALAGRRIDAPDTNSKRFPGGLAGSIKQKLADCFVAVKARHLVCSAACGSDLLAIQAAEELGIDSTVVLPFDHVLFRASSVVDRPGDWGVYYDEVVHQLKDAGRLVELSFQNNDPDAYLKTNHYILQRAEEIANHVAVINRPNFKELMAVIVWEGKPKDSDDSTYHFMEEAKKRNFEIRQVIIGA